jgi:glycosyltransferase involved in cell wall biosynthesis
VPIHSARVRPFGAERPLMFAYYGTRGALPKLTLDLAREASGRWNNACTFSLATSNELYDEFSFMQDNLFAVNTFASPQQWQSIACVQRVKSLCADLSERVANDKTRAIVSLMPHVWSPFLLPCIRRAGINLVSIIHDADPHPGDRHRWLHRWLLREAAAADQVITLSRAVSRRLIARGIPEEKISVLFHPDLDYGHFGSRENPHEPLRVLFLGRILPYKGLALFVDALDCLRASGMPVKAGVFGQGKIKDGLRLRLSALEAEVENRWLTHQEFAAVLSRYDLVVAAHTEASQSGVIAAAFGAGLPVVTTPVGGLVEQVTHGVTGMIAASASAHAIADAVRTIAQDMSLLGRLRHGVRATHPERSTARFFDELCDIALRPVPPRHSEAHVQYAPMLSGRKEMAGLQTFLHPSF